MKKIILLSFILLASCKCTQPTKKELTKKTDSLISIIKEQEKQIQDLELYNENLKDELRFREGEISYWGHKLDSVTEKLKKYENNKKNN